MLLVVCLCLSVGAVAFVAVVAVVALVALVAWCALLACFAVVALFGLVCVVCLVGLCLVRYKPKANQPRTNHEPNTNQTRTKHEPNTNQDPGDQIHYQNLTKRRLLLASLPQVTFFVTAFALNSWRPCHDMITSMLIWLMMVGSVSNKVTQSMQTCLLKLETRLPQHQYVKKVPHVLLCNLSDRGSVMP